MGYQDHVKELFDGVCDVYFSEDNGRFASYTLWQTNQMFKAHGAFDVVHWNNGYWDMNTIYPAGYNFAGSLGSLFYSARTG